MFEVDLLLLLSKNKLSIVQDQSGIYRGKWSCLGKQMECDRMMKK